MNSIGVIPSLNTTPASSDEESKGVKPLNVVTKAQKQNNSRANEETQIERSSRNSWKTRRQRRKATQKLQEENAKSNKDVVKKQDEKK